MNNSRFVAITILQEVLYKGAYSNIALNNGLNKSNLNKKDKSLVTEIVYGTLKYKYAIDCILGGFLKSNLKDMDKFIVNVLRISIYQIKYLDKIPDFAVVNEAVELSKKKSSKLSKVVNGVLRNYLRNKQSKYDKNSNHIDKLCFDYSFPKWMVKLFISQYGDENINRILKGLNATPKITVRVNRLFSDAQTICNELLENGYSVQSGIICKDSIVINRGSSINENPLFKCGRISVQDESAMLAVTAMDLTNGMVVFDMCSAPGGKSAYAAEIMGNTGQIFAFDIYKNKIKLIEANVERLGIKNIKATLQNAEIYNDELKEKADRVLIDLPCSGLGIIRKKPEIKWNKNMKQLKDIINIQRNIIKNASKYVKVSGKLIYSTCTINREENEKNVNWFINNNPEFELEKLDYGPIDNVIYHKEGYITILPNENMDGFFIAKMIKRR
ncbi:16S rRNA (cytosine(967)-C(5))-methyltransferase RsmB [Clostridium tyrobutyricum]|uniref:16S rRNA (cytosine(967)-C(5))-methyltransferase RsmB n=1 Tax=Clostridium tyrobutyricum TaxID=1519 RepID=UPI001C391762|nr:16S rRNA (cytosine(967)-C(5))-methyltransferase RsmB [Clostridium tyrobutyricum]MBV4418731.1 16S rRNA (cytosine(967)-C(5))-methyltransferase RsmB [Clostridium tyrobutyricum]